MLNALKQTKSLSCVIAKTKVKKYLESFNAYTIEQISNSKNKLIAKQKRKNLV